VWRAEEEETLAEKIWVWYETLFSAGSPEKLEGEAVICI
jgi:hypothetical protein